MMSCINHAFGFYLFASVVVCCTKMWYFFAFVVVFEHS